MARGIRGNREMLRPKYLAGNPVRTGADEHYVMSPHPFAGPNVRAVHEAFEKIVPIRDDINRMNCLFQVDPVVDEPLVVVSRFFPCRYRAAQRTDGGTPGRKVT